MASLVPPESSHLEIVRFPSITSGGATVKEVLRMPRATILSPPRGIPQSVARRQHHVGQTGIGDCYGRCLRNRQSVLFPGPRANLTVDVLGLARWRKLHASDESAYTWHASAWRFGAAVRVTAEQGAHQEDHCEPQTDILHAGHSDHPPVQKTMRWSIERRQLPVTIMHAVRDEEV